MELEFLDQDGRRVLARARDFVAGGEAEGRALVKALLEERRSLELILAVFTGTTEELLVLKPGVAPDGLARLAYEHAREAGVMIAGPEHLLIAAVRTSSPDAGLAQRGLTVEDLARAAVRLRGGRNTNVAPAGVTYTSVLLLAQGACCGWTLVFPLASAAATPTDGLALLVLANLCWSVVLPLYLALAVYSAEPAVWATTCGFQATRFASLASLWVYGVFSGGMDETIGLMALSCLMPPAVTAILVFRERKWFDVREREKWRTLRKNGGWTIVGTLLLDVGLMLMVRYGSAS